MISISSFLQRFSDLWTLGSLRGKSHFYGDRRDGSNLLSHHDLQCALQRWAVGAATAVLETCVETKSIPQRVQRETGARGTSPLPPSARRESVSRHLFESSIQVCEIGVLQQRACALFQLLQCLLMSL